METNAKITIKKVITDRPELAAALKAGEMAAAAEFANAAGMEKNFILLHLGTIKRWID